MSAHRTLNDLSRAFDSVGPGRLEDPGDAGTITVSQWGQICSVVTAAAETRTLAQPTKPGMECKIVLDVWVGNLTLTVTGGYNQTGTTTIVFGTAGDWVKFHSVKVGTSYYWRILSQEGTNAVITLAETAITTAAITTATITTLTSPTVATAHGVGAIGTGVAPVTTRRTENGVIITEIKIDMKGLASKNTANDIIGLAAGGAAYIGQNVVANNGVVFQIDMVCVQVPATGDPDVDFVTGSAATDVYDAAVTGAAVKINGGTWAAGTLIQNLVPALTANYYFYLTTGAGATAGTYTTGQFIIRLYGHPVLT